MQAKQKEKVDGRRWGEEKRPVIVEYVMVSVTEAHEKGIMLGAPNYDDCHHDLDDWDSPLSETDKCSFWILDS